MHAHIMFLMFIFVIFLSFQVVDVYCSILQQEGNKNKLKKIYFFETELYTKLECNALTRKNIADLDVCNYNSIFMYCTSTYMKFNMNFFSFVAV